MTRFWITLEKSVDMVKWVIRNGRGGEIFVPKIPSYRIMDLAKAISPSAKFKFVGIRPGEKIHEEMISTNESLNTVEFKNYFAIIPKSDFINWDKKKYLKSHKAGKISKNSFSYNSQTNLKFLSIPEIKKLIKNLN